MSDTPQIPPTFSSPYVGQHPIPVWAPNPGVPIVSRLLAYLFAALMLYTIAQTIHVSYTGRKPDIPAPPKEWETFTSVDGCTLPYPAHWATAKKPVETRKGDEMLEQAVFALSSDGQVLVSMLLFTFPQDVGYGTLDNIDQGIEQDSREHFADFTKTEATGLQVEGAGRTFNFTGEDRRKLPMAGGWVIVPDGRRVLCLRAVGPREAWSTMAGVLTHMANGFARP